MKRYIRSSETSSKIVDGLINEIKASEAVSNDDNYNPYSFMVGDQLEWSGLYGGEYKGVVTNVTDEYITVDVMWIAEDSGRLVTNTRRFEIATDPEGRECIIVYRYRDTVGYVYPPSNDYINSAEEFDVSNWKELASKSVEDSDGFYTDYTLYTDGQTYICMFGDKNLYEPDAPYADYETESEQDAWDWFNSYTGFADEEDEEYEYYDILESTEVIDSSQYPYRQNDLNDKLDTLYDRACATFGEDLVNKIVVECGGPTPEENPDSWWSDSLDTEKFYHKLTELFLNKMLNYEDFEDASDMDIFAYNCVAEEYGLPTVEDLDSPGYVYDPQKVWEQFRNKITNISSTTGVYYPNGKEVTDIDLDTYLDYNFGTDRDKDNSKYTTEEKQRSVDYWFKKHDTVRGSESTEVVNSGYSPELLNVKSSRKIRASWTYYPYALYSYTPGDAETGIEGDKFDIIDVVKSADIDEAKRYFKNKRILWYPNSFVDRISDEDYNAFLKEQEELARYESAVKSHNGSADEVINSSYSPDLLNDLVNYYRLFDTMSSEEIWDEIVAEYNNEDLANDVLESLDHEEDVDLADEEGAYDVYSSSDIKASMGRYDEYFGKTAAATYGDLIADRLRGKSVSKRRDTANEPGGLIYEANKLGIDMWDLLEALEGMCNEGRAREIDDSTYKILGASDLADEEDLPQADQEYDSAKTSINSNKLPAIYHMITLPEGSVGIDYGGGKFDNAVEALAEQGVTLYVYDPYNRSQQHNRAAIKALRANGGADFAINSNVLNVIKEPEARKGVLENIKKITKPGAPIYITVYEGRGDAKEGVTKSGYQLNRKTADYLEEIQEVFPNATRKGKLITATNSGSTKHIKSSRNATFRNDKRLSPTSERYKGYLIVLDRGGDGYNVYDKHRELEDAGYPSIDAAKKFIDELVANDDVYSAHSAEKVDWYELDWDEQIQLMKKYVRQYKGSRIFEDFAEYIDEPVEDIIDAFSDAEFRGDLRIPERMQLDSEYRNDDIYSTSQITRSVECAANIDDPNNNGWVKRWDFLDNYYKGNLVISKISSPVDGWHIEKVAPNGHTIKHLGNYKSLESAMEAADKHLCNHCGSHSYDENGNVVEASQSYLDRIEELMEQGLDEETASREAYAEFYPDDYDADDYDEIYSANYGGAYYVEVNSTQRGTAPYEKKFSDFNSAFSFAKKRGNSKTIIYIWDIPKEERSSNSVPNAIYDFDSGWQIIRPVNVNEDRSVNKTITSANYGGAYDIDPEQYFTREDLIEFADDVISCIANSQDILFDVSELYIEGNNITLGLTNTNNGGGFEHTVTFTVDMRKIRKPWDLQTKYSQKIANMFIDEYNKAIAEDEIYSSTTSSSRYWYFTRHGVQPGSVPKYVNILDIVDTPEGSYFLADGVILTDDLRNYEIKERKPKNDVVEASKSTKGETVEAGYYDIPEPPIDPPEDDSWTEVDGWIEDVDLDVDAIIEVLDDGSWIYEDETYPWAVSKDSYNGDHYSYEYYVHIGDPGTIVEDFDDVIEKYIPSEEGRYHLKCKATLKYFIEGVEVKQSDYHDEEVYKDNASVEFDEYDSKVENVSVERIW